MQTELQIHQERLKAVNEAIDLIERLAGNNTIAEEVLDNKGSREDYAPRAFYIDANEVISIIHSLKLVAHEEQSTIDGMQFQERRNGAE